MCLTVLAQGKNSMHTRFYYFDLYILYSYTIIILLLCPTQVMKLYATGKTSVFVSKQNLETVTPQSSH